MASWSLDLWFPLTTRTINYHFNEQNVFLTIFKDYKAFFFFFFHSHLYQEFGPDDLIWTIISKVFWFVTFCVWVLGKGERGIGGYDVCVYWTNYFSISFGPSGIFSSVIITLKVLYLWYFAFLCAIQPQMQIIQILKCEVQNKW